MTCYDLRFPEVSRVLADTGAHVILVAAEWVRGPLKEDHWRTLLHARAIENTLYVAGADHPPPLGVGHSVVVDPQGVPSSPSEPPPTSPWPSSIRRSSTASGGEPRARAPAVHRHPAGLRVADATFRERMPRGAARPPR